MELMPMLMSGLSAFKVFFVLKRRNHSILKQNDVQQSNTSLQMLLALCPLLSPSITTTRTSKKLRSDKNAIYGWILNSTVVL